MLNKNATSGAAGNDSEQGQGQDSKHEVSAHIVQVKPEEEDDDNDDEEDEEEGEWIRLWRMVEGTQQKLQLKFKRKCRQAKNSE